jgi:DNA-binding transcriptional ArsR family regulator
MVEQKKESISYALYIIDSMSRPFSNWDVYKAIADPNRRIVLDLLMRGDHTAGAILARVQLTQPALSQHLKVLRDVGLVRQRRNGRERIYSLNPKPLREVSDWVRHYEAFWERKLTALGEHLDRRAALSRSSPK